LDFAQSCANAPTDDRLPGQRFAGDVRDRRVGVSGGPQGGRPHGRQQRRHRISLGPGAIQPVAGACRKAIGKTLLVLNASQKDDIEKVFATIAEERVDALLVTVDPVFIVNRVQIIETAARQRVPTLYFQREFVDLGGLMSYGASAHDASRLVGGYAARIVRGARPADLPIQRSTKIETIVNLRTARSLGLTIPPTLLARSDEVIE
jgi:putative ABC transport system substrate-binding protein